uniref:Uncharacterized protein n=1 Tax=Anguilla anguilla TaxID=7936 RepID=A0A0E9T822_ANGAN
MLDQDILMVQPLLRVL